MELRKWLLNQLSIIMMYCLLTISTTSLFVDAIGYDITLWQVLPLGFAFLVIVYILMYSKKTLIIFLIAMISSGLIGVYLYFKVIWFKESIFTIITFMKRYQWNVDTSYDLSSKQELVMYCFIGILIGIVFHLLLFKWKSVKPIYFLILLIVGYSFYFRIFDNKMALILALVCCIALFFYEKFNISNKTGTAYYWFYSQILLLSVVTISVCLTLAVMVPYPFAWTRPAPEKKVAPKELEVKLEDEINFKNKLLFTVKANRSVYLRQSVFVAFDGKGWTLKQLNGSEVEDQEKWFENIRTKANALGYSIDDVLVQTKGEVNTKDFISSKLSSPEHTFKIETENEDITYKYTPETGIYSYQGSEYPYYTFYAYTLKTNQTRFIELINALEKTTSSPSQSKQFYEEYSQKFESITPRTKALAKEITKNATTKYEKVVAIEHYLKSNFIYNYKVFMPENDQDIVDYFLFESKQGWCSYFASAMIVLLREVNIPSRMVTGFVLKPEYEGLPANVLEIMMKEQSDPNITKNYNVRDNNAHAWVEVYFEGIGWVPFEPTASFDNSFSDTTIEKDPLTIKKELETIKIQNHEKWNGMILFLVIMTTIILGIVMINKLLSLSRMKLEDQYERSLRKYFRKLAQLGYPLIEGMTLNEYATCIEEGNIPLSESVQNILKQVERIKYGKTVLESSDLKLLKQSAIQIKVKKNHKNLIQIKSKL